MGGRGATSLGNDKGTDIDVKSTQDVWSFRHNKNNEGYVDAINSGVASVQHDFPDMMDSVDTVNTAELRGASKYEVMGYFEHGDKGTSINMNQFYASSKKMNRAYDDTVKSGFHPSRGNKSGTEAVAIHETGHALTYHLMKAYGTNDMYEAARKIVSNAYKNSSVKGGIKKWAGRISNYAKQSNAECIAEAVADFYCNGSKASSSSHAIMAELRKAYSKMGGKK